MMALKNATMAILFMFLTACGGSTSEEASTASQMLPPPVSFEAWIGTEDTQLTFPIEAKGMAFYRSKEEDCDVSNYSVCKGGRLDFVSDHDIFDPTFTDNQSAYYQLVDSGNVSRSLRVTRNEFRNISGHQVVQFKSRLWLIGNSDVEPIWVSDDGIDWTLATEKVDFISRRESQAVYFNGKLFLIGGFSQLNNEALADVWVSEDGIIWRLTSDTAQIPPRMGHQVIAFENKLWMIGGTDGRQKKNDIWVSEDGITWDQVQDDAEFSARWGHQVTAFDNKLWLVGGNDGSDRSDVWVSEDGMKWNIAASNAEFGPRSQHQVSNFSGKLFLSGGYGTSAANASWVSEDGRHWREAPESTLPSYTSHQMTAFGSRIWIVGGNDGYGLTNDIWFSDDGLKWIKTKDQNNFPLLPIYRSAYRSAIFDGKLWLFEEGGLGNAPYKVWSSNDGLSWSHSADANFPIRQGYPVTVFKNKLWVVGGTNADYVRMNDVWFSDDGASWSQATENATFSGRSGHLLVTFDQKLWIFGGTDKDHNYLNDVWYTEDGIHWIQATDNSGIYHSRNSKLVGFSGKLWLFGDYNCEGNSIWFSEDGASWTQITDNADFSHASGFQVAVFKENIWLIGGRESHVTHTENGCTGEISADSGIWSSEDGINWKKHAGEVPFSKESSSLLGEFSNRLWMVGGGNDVWRSENAYTWRLGYRNTVRFE